MKKKLCYAPKVAVMNEDNAIIEMIHEKEKNTIVSYRIQHYQY